MNIGSQIASLRKSRNITQEALAQQLGVTNQAVSKWESGQCCPDVALLPKLADLFGVTIDELFGRSTPTAEPAPVMPLPWQDDGVLRAVLFVGRQLIDGHPAAETITFQYEGDALDVQSAFSVSCGNVEGDVIAGKSVDCGNVEGDVHTKGAVSCGNVEGDVQAEGTVSCGNIEGDLTANGSVNCGDVGGDVDAAGNVTCGDIGGDVRADCVTGCGSIGGTVQFR